MLGKLMKYEFLSMGRIFLPMYGALLAIALINRLLTLLPHSAPVVISTVIASVMIAAVAVITLILILQRFMKNLLSDEGYLMMTLPVKTDYLILSKMFVATIFTFASYLVTWLTILILASSDFAYMGTHIQAFFSDLEPRYLLIAFQALIFLLLTTFASILLLYACMALSLFFNKRRGLISFGFFVGITTIMQIITAIILASSVYMAFDRPTFHNMDDFAVGQIVMFIFIAIALINCAIFYSITRFMLKRRLNLL